MSERRSTILSAVRAQCELRSGSQPSPDLDEIQLVACDIDGTLTEPGTPIPLKTRVAIAAVRKMGIPVVLATGRQVASASAFAVECGLSDMPMICYQGAVVAYPDTPSTQWLAHTPLETEIALQVIDRYRATNHINVYVDDVIHCERYDEAARRYEDVDDAAIRIVDDIRDLVARRGTTKIIVFATSAGARETLLADMRETFGATAWVTHSRPQFVEVCQQEVSKAQGMRRVCEELDVSLAAVLACGDGNNDVAMLDAAALAAVPSSAAAAVRAHGDITIGSPEQCGVAPLFERLVAQRAMLKNDSIEFSAH